MTSPSAKTAESFLTLKSMQFESVIKKSRFIAIADSVEDAEDAERKLAEIRKKYSDSTHVCYAYIADILGNEARFSDAGEPQGTAGRPILDIMKKAGLCKGLIAVVRYFGGVKLGAGGLVRAYAGAADDVIRAGAAVKMQLYDVFRIECDYPSAAALETFLSKTAKVLDSMYTDCVIITTAFPSVYQDAPAKINDICRGGANVTFIKSEYLAAEKAAE